MRSAGIFYMFYWRVVSLVFRYLLTIVMLLLMYVSSLYAGIITDISGVCFILRAVFW